MEIKTCTSDQLSQKEILMIRKLINDTWPPEEPPAPIDFARYYSENRHSIETNIFIADNIVAHAKIFPRTIYLDDNTEKTVSALAEVCVTKDQRGKGLGKKLIGEVFSRVSENNRISLFQTGAADFYRKLGAKEIYNTFINNKNTEAPGKTPWWEESVMVFPSDCDWPDNIQIDLNGPAY